MEENQTPSVLKKVEYTGEVEVNRELPVPVSDQTSSTQIEEDNSKIKELMGGGIGEEMLMSIVKPFIPKLKTFLAPQIQKAREYLGNDEHRIHIGIVQGKMMAIIYNTKFPYEISNTKFSIDKKGIVRVIPIEEFMEQCLSGDLLKQFGGG